MSWLAWMGLCLAGLAAQAGEAPTGGISSPPLRHRCEQPLPLDSRLDFLWQQGAAMEVRYQLQGLLESEWCHANSAREAIESDKARYCRGEESAAGCFLRWANERQGKQPASVFGMTYLFKQYMQVAKKEGRRKVGPRSAAYIDVMLAEADWMRNRGRLNERMTLKWDLLEGKERMWAEEQCRWLRASFRLMGDKDEVLYRLSDRERALADLGDCSTFLERP